MLFMGVTSKGKTRRTMRSAPTHLRILIRLSAAAAASCAQSESTLSSRSSALVVSALTAEQCLDFEEGGKVTICHATGSTKNTVVKLQVATAACIDAHAHHAH